MTLDEDVALASYTEGVDDDGWIGRSAKLCVLTYAPLSPLTLGFWTPADFSVRKIRLNKARIRELEGAIRAQEAAPAACGCSEELSAMRTDLKDLRSALAGLSATTTTPPSVQAVRELERVARGAVRRAKRATKR